MKTYLAFMALAFLAVSSLFAQTGANEAGIFVVTSNLSSTTISDPEGDIRLDYSEKAKYGLSLNHFWTDNVSTELALQKIGADLNFRADPTTVNVGKLDATSLTAIAQWHFLRGARVSPYLGAGVAHLSGHFNFNEALLDPGEDPHIELESYTTWTAAAGANIRLTDRVAFATELKYVPWKPRQRGVPDDEGINVDPLTISAGLRLRF